MLLWQDSFRERLAAGGRYVIHFDNRDVGRTTCCPPGEPNYDRPGNPRTHRLTSG
ncbi:MAG: hypothetical protein J4G14_15185 [Dehalococcoidia bacterium]|nr:hypothetical protein [Dehalococcoidia bacterium]